MYRNDQTMRQTVPAGGHGQPQQFVTRHDASSTTELTTTLTHAIANVTGTDVTDVETRLYDCIDPMAVNRLFDGDDRSTAGTHASLTLTIWGHHVTVSSTGHITISRPHGRGAIQG